jgi:hypothetical protein
MFKISPIANVGLSRIVGVISFIKDPSSTIFRGYTIRSIPVSWGLINNYRHPCVATEPIMFCYGLFLFFLFFYSPFVLRNYPTDSHQIFRNCVFWCSLNNPVVSKFFWRHRCRYGDKRELRVVHIRSSLPLEVFLKTCTDDFSGVCFDHKSFTVRLRITFWGAK